MPGKNSGHNPAKDKLIHKLWFSKIWVFVIIIVIILELWGMGRYFYTWEKRRYCTESFVLTLYFIISDFLVFKSMITAKNADPGYLIPD